MTSDEWCDPKQLLYEQRNTHLSKRCPVKLKPFFQRLRARFRERKRCTYFFYATKTVFVFANFRERKNLDSWSRFDSIVHLLKGCSIIRENV